MNRRLLRLAACVLIFTLLLSIAPAAFAEPSAGTAADITGNTEFSGTGFTSYAFLKDGNIKEYASSTGDAEITLKNNSGIGSLYLLFDLEYGEYTITDNDTGVTITAGERGFLHEYIALKSTTTSVTIRFSNGKVRLSELYVFSTGSAPDFVQVWDAPLEGKADLVLFATHGDDEQLFFAGLLPYYAQEVGCAVQVVYMTDHRNLTNARTHEMLNGLWSVGVRAYPVFGGFADFLIEDKQGTYDEYAKMGVTQEMLQSYVVEQIRRFKPQVAVGHDLNGEYKHGMHMVYADLLVKALDMTNDAACFPESAEKYGLWDIPKTYLHLYETNPIVLNYDVPLESFQGMTAFDVTRELGYPCHESQQYTWFTKWLHWEGMRVNGTPIIRASQIEQYNPCKFGLYRSTVGEDVQKNDFLENIVTYAEQERLEQERLEQERLEQERLEQERLEQERLEQERLEQERLEQERLEQERLERQKAKDARDLGIALTVLCMLVVTLIAVLLWAYQDKRRRQKRRAAGIQK